MAQIISILILAGESKYIEVGASLGILKTCTEISLKEYGQTDRSLEPAPASLLSVEQGGGKDFWVPFAAASRQG